MPFPRAAFVISACGVFGCLLFHDDFFAADDVYTAFDIPVSPMGVEFSSEVEQASPKLRPHSRPLSRGRGEGGRIVVGVYARDGGALRQEDAAGAVGLRARRGKCFTVIGRGLFRALIHRFSGTSNQHV